MSKYDFGYELESGSTNEWAFQSIPYGSKVLELGASVGNLTSHLVEKKNCIVDIVEIDQEAGEKASKWARIALVGNVEGDLNGDVWDRKLIGENYQYVVILDVLEHLMNPDQVIKKVKLLLGENGKIVVSVPNIAHNSVLVNLFNNKFDYTEFGLLDRTHIHFFTRESLTHLFSSNQLYIESENAILKNVGDTEINNSYSEVPQMVEFYLRTRNLANVYQFLYIVKKDDSDEYKDLIKDGRMKEYLYSSIVLVNGLEKNRIDLKTDLSKIDMIVDLKKYEDAQDVRFIPVEHNCIVSDLKVYGYLNDIEEQIFYNWSSGINVSSKEVILADMSREINFHLEKKYDKIRIKCVCVLINDNSLKNVQAIFEALKSNVDNMIRDLDLIKSEKNRIEIELENLRKQNDMQIREAQAFEEENLLLKEINKSLEKKVNESEKLKLELIEKNDEYKRLEESFKRTIFYKLYKLMKR